MRLSDHITRLPRAFDPVLGAEAGAAVPDLKGDLAELVTGAGGSSPYLKGLIEREAAWLTDAANDVDTAVRGVFEAVRAAPPDQLRTVLRQAKRRIALITALADIAGAWPLERVTGALTDLADLACDLALKAEIATLIRRGKLPGQSEDDIAAGAGLCVFAMGKMGAQELNYSSDIDLICLFDETRYDPLDFQEVRQGMVRATRNMSSALNDRTAEGYVFRTDLRLRPDPSVTPVCLAMIAAEHYYESLGRTWERAAFIKARPAAGDLVAGDGFLATLKPFIWRRHLDFAAIQDAHDIRLRIRETKGTGGALSVPGHDMKLGRGGIREIEFFTQTRQLIAGGRDSELRQRGTVPGLTALAAKGWVPDDVAEQLIDHYRALREVEHRIQMVHDAQTHVMPNTDDGIARIACLMGCDPDVLCTDLRRRLTEVHDLTEGFFVPEASPRPKPEEIPEGLDTNVLARWPTYPALRSQRARRIFDRLRPELLTRLSRTARPDQALVALDGFLAGLPAGVQVFSLLEANPQLVDLLIDIVGTASRLAGYLSRNASVFDAVIGGDFFADWPGQATLGTELTARLAGEADYERQLDFARRWTKEWHFRVGVHYLRGLIDAETAGEQYADLAEAVISAVTPFVLEQFAVKHGDPPGRGAMVLGMGSLGARRLTASSDLDLIVIYDAGDVEASEGPRPLAARTYYARLTQALITALTAPMAEGRLYEVDMRLRPSGSQGPVATSVGSFESYHRTDARIWEHLALTRARPVAGDPELAAEVEGLRREILERPQERRAVLAEVADLRERIAAAKTPAGVWDVKTGAGRMMDIELMAQAGALLSGSPEVGVPEGLRGTVACGWLSEAEGATLSAAYALYWSVRAGASLLSSEPLDADVVGEGGAAFLCRSAGYDSLDVLQAALEAQYDKVDRLIGAALLKDCVS